MGACVMLCGKKESALPEHEIKYIQSQVQAELHAEQNLQLPKSSKEQQSNIKTGDEPGGFAMNMLRSSTKTSSRSRFFVERSVKSNKQTRLQGDDSLNQTSFTQKFSERVSIRLDKFDFIDQNNQKIVFQHLSSNKEKNENIKISKGDSSINDQGQIIVVVKNKKLLLFKENPKKVKRQNYAANELITKQKVINTKITYEDGSQYDGDIIQGLRDGLGKYFWADGTIYEGQWKHDNIEGIGLLTFENGDQYRGHFSKNKANGQGQFCNVNGINYVGQWQNGLEEGQGCENFKDQQRYVGGWMLGKKEGYGQLFYFDGSYYKGNFSNNQINGQGQYYWVGKSTYKGNWLHNQKCGFGSILWQNGDKYEGQFIHDKMHGKGKYYTKSGVIYDGNWQKGRKQGKFKEISPSGEVKQTFWVFNKKIQQINKRQNHIIKKIKRHSSPQ